MDKHRDHRRYGIAQWMMPRTAPKPGGRRALYRALSDALAAGDFDVRYQPVIDLQQGGCVGVEALIRWVDPAYGIVDPDLFIPHAERTGLIIPITRWLLRRVRDDFCRSSGFAAGFHIGVNLAPCHLADAALGDDLDILLGDSALDPVRIVLEITERAPVHPSLRPVLDALRARGVALAIDDFGTGHAGLSVLQKFRFDYLKIDRSFVSAIGTDAPHHLVLDAIIALAHRLDLVITAEGVETPAQRAYLRRAGVRFAQGYLFSKPLSYADLVLFQRERPPGPPDCVLDDVPAGCEPVYCAV